MIAILEVDKSSYQQGGPIDMTMRLINSARMWARDPRMLAAMNKLPNAEGRGPESSSRRSSRNTSSAGCCWAGSISLRSMSCA